MIDNKFSLAFKNSLESVKYSAAVCLALFTCASANAQSQTEESASGQAIDAVEEVRWFEIEVILVEPLMDKSRYNEKFIENDRYSSKNKTNIDLLNQHLQSIVSYSQQLDKCESAITTKNNEKNQLQLSLQTTDQTDVLNNNPNDEQQRIREQIENLEHELKDLSIDCRNQTFDDFDDTIAESYYQIPTLISSNEDLDAKNPYLLNKSSLQLKHINKSLRRSKNFRPLLHMGWRQVVKDRRNAVPVRMLAGKNYALAQQDYTETQQELAAIDIPAEQKQQMISDHIKNIIVDVQQNQLSMTTLVAALKAQQLSPLFDSVANKESIEQKPLPQTFAIDGLFNVHLDHYLFINSQFNVMVQNQEEDAQQQFNTVPFKQNRRVISGEVHYFDHPYMGMIVQIRRHKQNEPELLPEQDINSDLDQTTINVSN